MRFILKVAVFAGLSVMAQPALAQELRIAMKAGVDSADPHLLYTPNRNVQIQVYEPLVGQDERMNPRPGLAESWKAVDPTTWEFRLYPGIRFSDGTPLSAEDVVFSLNRAQTIDGARTYRAYLKDVASVSAKDPTTVIVKTKGPAPSLPRNLAIPPIVSARAAADAKPDDFNGGRAAIGTGPYRWVRFAHGGEVVLERNLAYRGPAPAWERVIYKFVSNDSARVAALLSGDADVIDAVPGSLVSRLSGNAKTQTVSTTSVFLLYLHLDRFRSKTPFATDDAGQVLERNPFNVLQVRRALTLAINRPALAERVMEGGATPAGQFVPEGFVGYTAKLPPIGYDPARAKALLVEAGYPNGFNLTLHCMNDRFTGDVQTCQAIASMFTAIGVRTKVEAMPASVFYRRARTGDNGQPEFSATIAGFGPPTGDGLDTTTTLIHSFDGQRGLANQGRYSNRELDTQIERAQELFDESARQELLDHITRQALDDVAVVPIYFLKSTWGLRRGLEMRTRGDSYTVADQITPVGK